MQQLDLLDADLALARMVLAEVGVMERQLTRWMAAMLETDPNIFEKLAEAWMARHKPQIARYYGIMRQPLLDNVTRSHIPLEACMQVDLLRIGSLPRAPDWYQRYAQKEVSFTLGFATSRLFPSPAGFSETAPRHKPKSGMLDYMRCFKSTGQSLPDETWFDQAAQDMVTMRQDFPHLDWLARELILRDDRSTPLEDMDDRLEFFQVPDAARPSQKNPVPLCRSAEAARRRGGSHLRAKIPSGTRALCTIP